MSKAVGVLGAQNGGFTIDVCVYSNSFFTYLVDCISRCGLPEQELLWRDDNSTELRGPPRETSKHG